MAQVKPTVLAEIPAIHPNSVDKTIQKLVSRISGLAKSLNAKTLDEAFHVGTKAELNESVEKFFFRAIDLSEARDSSSICE